MSGMLRKLIGATRRRKVHRLARKWFGLQITTVPERRFDLWYYEMNSTHIRRLLHFEAILTMLEDVDGRIVECGVGPGRSMLAFSMITQYVTKPRDIVGFDTFDGIPPPTSEDGEANVHKTGWWRHSIDNVVELLKHNGLSEAVIEERVSFKPGLFEDTLPNYDGMPIAFLHIDVDFYKSYSTVLRELWPHVAPGGIVAFDEYRNPVFPGATQAVDEFFVRRREEPVKSNVTDLYYVIKGPVNVIGET